MDSDNSSIIISAISFLSIIAIVWLFLHYSKNYEKEKPKARILYISGYLILIIIGLIEYICLGTSGNKDNIINYISFGSTLSSLILSVVAIIFTIVSGRSNEEQLGKISQATKELQITASSIDKFREISEKLNLRLDDIHNELCVIHRESKEIHRGIDDINTKQSINTFLSTKDLKSEIEKEIVKKETNLDKESNEITETAHSTKSNHYLEIDLENFYLSISYSGAFMLLACVYSKKSNKPFNTDKMGRWFQGDNLAYMLGFLIATSAIGLVKYEGTLPNVSVTEDEDEMELRASIIISVCIKNTDDKKFRDEQLSGFNELRSYFDLPPVPLKAKKWMLSRK